MSINEKHIERYKKLRATEADATGDPNEKATAQRIRQRMESDHPGIEKAAGFGNPFADKPMPDAYTSGSPWVADTPPQDFSFGQKAASWARNLASDFLNSVDLAHMARLDAEIDIHSNTRTVHIHCKVPVDALYDAAERSGGNIDEYAQRIGQLIAQDLATAFREAN